MLATGGTLAAAVQFLVNRGADHITCICLLAAPGGDRAAHGAARRPRTYRARWSSAAVDERLNEEGYIVPGLGDAGDRLYGVVRLAARGGAE